MIDEKLLSAEEAEKLDGFGLQTTTNTADFSQDVEAKNDEDANQ